MSTDQPSARTQHQPFAGRLLLPALILGAIFATSVDGAPIRSEEAGTWQIVRFSEGGQFWERATPDQCEAAENEPDVVCVPGATTKPGDAAR